MKQLQINCSRWRNSERTKEQQKTFSYCANFYLREGKTFFVVVGKAWQGKVIFKYFSKILFLYSSFFICSNFFVANVILLIFVWIISRLKASKYYLYCRHSLLFTSSSFIRSYKNKTVKSEHEIVLFFATAWRSYWHLKRARDKTIESRCGERMMVIVYQKGSCKGISPTFVLNVE